TPYPRWPAPSPAESDHVAWLLGRHHGYTPESEGGSGLPHYTPPSGGEGKFAGCGDVQDVLEATIRTILSCNTSGKNSRAAHQSMVAAFGWNDWPRVLAAPEGELEEALRCGGLAKTKARNIQLLLAQTKERFGSLSLQHLHEASDAEVLETLLSFKGCGPKVASCVALFCLGRPEMAVDAHIFRLSKALGWVPPNASRETTYYHLNERIPRHLRYPLHVLLIQHGKACPNCT
ncbi:DNA glycosylase, partial [Jaminaea rosea]